MLLTEPAFFYNWKTHTAKLVKLPAPRAYDEAGLDRTCEVPGSGDLVVRDAAGIVVVDYKTGRTPWESYRDQLTFLALCVSRIFNEDEVTCIVAKVDDKCVVTPHQWLADELQLDAFAAKLAKDMGKVPDALPVRGEHCSSKYCSIRSTCPAITGVAVQLVKPPPALNVFPVGGKLTIERAKELYDILPAVEDAVKRAHEEIHRIVDEHGFLELSNGSKLVKREKTRETVKVLPAAAQEHLLGVLGPSYADAVSVKTSKAAIERLTPGGKKAAQVLLEELRSMGVISSAVYPDYVVEENKDSNTKGE